MDLTPDQSTDLAPRLKEAGEAAVELMKQLIALSSGVLALSAAFLDKFPASNRWEYLPLLLSWGLLIVSLITALDSISAVVKSYLTPEHKWHMGRGKRSGSISKWTFVVGISSFGLFALLTTWSAASLAEKDTKTRIVGVRSDTAPAAARSSNPATPVKSK